MVGITFRNVSSTYLKFRTEHKNKKHRFGSSILGGFSPSGGDTSGQQRLLTQVVDDDSRGIEMSRPLPPVWVDVVDECRDDMNRIKEKMSQLQKAQQKKLLKVFDDDASSHPDKEIEALTVAITQFFKKCENRLHLIKVQNSTGLDKQEFSQRKNAQISIATQLQSLNQAFRKQQVQYVNEVKRRQKGTDFFQAAPRPSEGRLNDHRFSDTMMAELETTEQDIGTRNEEIAKIAQSVAELHAIFKELAVLVIDQGTILDRIDYNVEQVVSQTEQATVQLRKAEEHQKSGRATKCITSLVSIIFFLVVMLIIKHIR